MGGLVILVRVVGCLGGSRWCCGSGGICGQLVLGSGWLYPSIAGIGWVGVGVWGWGLVDGWVCVNMHSLVWHGRRASRCMGRYLWSPSGVVLMS